MARLERPSKMVRVADVLRVDFPGGPMKWIVTSINEHRVFTQSSVSGTSSSIDKVFLEYLMGKGAVRRSTPMELMES